MAPFAKVDGKIIFTNAAANSDEATHLRALDTNTFGLEETLNTDNGDYNDAITKESFNQISSIRKVCLQLK